MMHFNELRITQDNKFLIIDVSVDSQDYFTNILLDTITIDTQDTYITNGPSDTPVFSYTVDPYSLIYSLPENCNCSPISESQDETYCFTYGATQMKNARLEILISDLHLTNTDNTMFFIYVKSQGTPALDTPCGFYKDTLIGTVINLQPIYRQTLNYLKEVEDDCTISKNFIDMILKFKAVDLCIRTGNYPQAIKYWNKFLAKYTPTTTTCNCG